MTREEKSLVIDNLTAQLADNNVIYVTDLTGLNAQDTTALRRACFKANIKLAVVKIPCLLKQWKLQKKNLVNYQISLKGNTSLMYAEVGNVPAKLIKEFRKKSEKPILKGAYVDAAVFIGDNQLDALAALKSKNEVIGDIIGLLQSPAKTLFQPSNQVAANWLVSYKNFI